MKNWIFVQSFFTAFDTNHTIMLKAYRTQMKRWASVSNDTMIHALVYQIKINENEEEKFKAMIIHGSLFSSVICVLFHLFCSSDINGTRKTFSWKNNRFKKKNRNLFLPAFKSLFVGKIAQFAPLFDYIQLLVEKLFSSKMFFSLSNHYPVFFLEK